MVVDSNLDLDAVVSTVSRNCAISDARHAREFSLCIYLLRMREHYRWLNNLPLTQSLEIDQVGNWLTETEASWDDLDEADYEPLSVNGQLIDPFDHEAVNKYLNPEGLVYAAGIGRFGQPHFFIAHIAKKETTDDFTCYHCSTELIRDILTQPAMARGNEIFIRHDCIRRIVWQQIEEWKNVEKNRTQENDSQPEARRPADRFIRHYKLGQRRSLEQNLDQAVSDLIPIFHLHELGEHQAGKLLGNAYRDHQQQHLGTRTELYSRAIRDMLADLLSTLPTIWQQKNHPLLDYWIANLTGIRYELGRHTAFNQLLTAATSAEGMDQLGSLIDSETHRWTQIANQFIRLPDESLSNDNINEAVSALVSSGK